MVKKIGVFITILSLFFLGMPQFNSKAQSITVYMTYQEDKNGAWEEIMITDLYISLNELLYNNLMTSNFEIILNNREIDFYSEGISQDLIYSPYSIVFSGNYNQIIVDGDSIEELSLSDFLDMEWEIYFTQMPLDEGIDYFDGYNDGFSDGYDAALEQYAYYDWVNDKWLTAEELQEKHYNSGYAGGWSEGYYAGLEETDATGFSALLTTIFGGLGSLLAIEILPGIYIGAIIAVPLVFGIIFFILGKRKGD